MANPTKTDVARTELGRAIPYPCKALKWLVKALGGAALGCMVTMQALAFEINIDLQRVFEPLLQKENEQPPADTHGCAGQNLKQVNWALRQNSEVFGTHGPREFIGSYEQWQRTYADRDHSDHCLRYYEEKSASLLNNAKGLIAAQARHMCPIINIESNDCSKEQLSASALREIFAGHHRSRRQTVPYVPNDLAPSGQSGLG